MWINNVRGRFKCKCWAVTLAIFKMSVRVIVLLFMLPLLHTGEGRTSSTDWVRYYMVNHGCRDSPNCDPTTEEGFCRFSPWTEWTECTGCAPIAEQNTSRTCLTDTCESGLCRPERTEYVRKCTGESIPCCEGYPRWTEWGPWQVPCANSCGRKRQTRKRGCLQCTFTRDCRLLPGSTTDEEDCPDPCPPKCIEKTTWERWSIWSRCEADPTNPLRQIKFRDRKCSTRDCGDGTPCVGEWNETAICGQTECHGYWGQWSSWSACPKKCNTFTYSTRQRPCNAHSRCGRDYCEGHSTETKQCLFTCCTGSGDLTLTDWTPWSTCTKSCGRGIQKRSRQCLGSKKCLRQQTCTEELKEKRTCFTSCCKKVKLGRWGPWSSCSSTCGGTSTRKRKCKPRKCETNEINKDPCEAMKKETRDCPKSDDPSCKNK